MGKINRDDMLELTRRMTLKRNCFSRIAGAYLDEEGFVDGTFNTHFLKLSQRDIEKNLAIAKAVPFAKTNDEIKEYRISEKDKQKGGNWQLLMGLLDCELKNDALLDVFYEYVGEKYKSDKEYAVYFFYGFYDIPLIGSDKVSQWESEEMYKFIVCAICPVTGDYEAGKPECGFLFPAYKDHGAQIDYIDILNAEKMKDIFEL